MKRYTRNLLLAALIAGLVLTAGVVWAGPKLFSGQADFGPNTCTTLNCNAVDITGMYTHDQNTSNADPFIAQVFTDGADCVRIDVTSVQPVTDDLEATLTCPNGQTWVSDDGPNSNKPLIRAIQDTGHRGWCTLTISASNGEQASAVFTFKYGRYNIGNVSNCPSNFGGPVN